MGSVSVGCFHEPFTLFAGQRIPDRFYASRQWVAAEVRPLRRRFGVQGHCREKQVLHGLPQDVALVPIAPARVTAETSPLDVMTITRPLGERQLEATPGRWVKTDSSRSARTPRWISVAAARPIGMNRAKIHRLEFDVELAVLRNRRLPAAEIPLPEGTPGGIGDKLCSRSPVSHQAGARSSRSLERPWLSVPPYAFSHSGGSVNLSCQVFGVSSLP